MDLLSFLLHHLFFRNIGIIAYMLLTHTSPFVGEDNQETYLNISQVNVDYSEETFSSVSQLATDFIQTLLVKNPEWVKLSAKCCYKTNDMPLLRKAQSTQNASNICVTPCLETTVGAWKLEGTARKAGRGMGKRGTGISVIKTILCMYAISIANLL